jgi:hypothetical protein
MSETRKYAALLQNAGEFFRVDSQGWHPGLVWDAPLGHGIGNTVMARYRKRDERRKPVILGSPNGRHPLLTHPQNSGCLVFLWYRVSEADRSFTDNLVNVTSEPRLFVLD